MPVHPSNSEFEADVRESFSRQELMRTLGAELESVAAGRVHVALRARPELSQQAGLLHAGAIAAIADSACGYAALTLMPAGADVVSVEFKLNLLAPARGDRFVARGEVVRAGKTLTVCRADVFGKDETIVATMLATMMRR